MSVDLTALKTELTTDPTGLGYPPDAADTAADASIINTLGISGETIEPEFVTTLQAHAAIELTEFLTLTSGEQSFWLAMIQSAAAGGGFPVKDPAVRAQIGALFRAGEGNQPDTRAALIVLQTRTATRAEVLFGEGISASPQDCAQARALP